MGTLTKPLQKRTPRPNEDPSEAGRAGGVASGEARRAKRDAQPRHWGDVLRDAIQENPEQIVRNLLRSQNGAALVGALQLVRDIEAGKMRRLADIDAESSRLDHLCCDLLDDCEREEARKAQLLSEVYDLGGQRRELESQLRELREAIEREAAEHDMELVDDGSAGGVGDAVAPQTAA